MNIQITKDTLIVNWKHPENGFKVILDPGDNITNKTTEHGAYEYTYDNLYRLTDVDNPVQTDEEFTYDNVGNRLTAADTTGSWAYNQNNELGGYDTTSFVYDDNGNMIQKTVDGVVTSYVYNVEDRLTEVWDGEVGTGTLIATYYYDPFGRRLWKELSGVKTHFHYADEGLIGEYDSAGSEIKTYGYKPNSTWTTDPLFMKVGSSYYFYHNDHLGIPQKMTGVNGAVVWSAKYSSFGKTDVDVSSTVTNNLRFAGQYYDTETELNHNRFRYYDSKLGRYLRSDPVTFYGGDTNLYTYVRSNPATFYDPLGLWHEDVHYGNPNSDYGTYTWAMEVGFTESGAYLIAQGNNSVDWIFGTSPLTGNQARHFNKFSRDGYCDSRLYYADQEFFAAIALYREGREDQALMRLGMGLHSLQDYFAHRDWDTGPVGVVPHPPEWDDWDNPDNAEQARQTEEATMEYLREFARLTYGGYTH